ncbi:MAG: PAS domain S-box protein [Bdellovibrionaceae bacterium]|nr:PAS domain S-box protein [Pseudobdellovibrionaceae bacterium]
MIQAKNIMHRSTPVLPFSASIPEAIEFLKAQPKGFAIVQATADRFHGVLTEAQLMRIFLRYQANPDRDTLILYRDLFEPAQLIHEDEYFPEIVKKLVSAAGNRVFVIDNKSNVVGYITAKDILPYFSPKGADGQAGDTAGEALTSNLYLYESFFTKSPFLMHSVNREGVIQMANEVLHRVLGFEFGELHGRTIFDIYPKEHHAKAEAGLKAILNQGYHSAISAEMRAKDGKTVAVEMISRVLTDQRQSPVGTMTVSRPLDMNLLLKVLPEMDAGI